MSEVDPTDHEWWIDPLIAALRASMMQTLPIVAAGVLAAGPPLPEPGDLRLEPIEYGARRPITDPNASVGDVSPQVAECEDFADIRRRMNEMAAERAAGYGRGDVEYVPEHTPCAGCLDRGFVRNDQFEIKWCEACGAGPPTI
jgi:hypothetical protein